jgi:hypothetical protein
VQKAECRDIESLLNVLQETTAVKQRPGLPRNIAGGPKRILMKPPIPKMMPAGHGQHSQCVEEIQFCALRAITTAID